MAGMATSGVELVLRGVGPSDYIPFDTERSNSVVILKCLVFMLSSSCGLADNVVSLFDVLWRS